MFRNFRSRSVYRVLSYMSKRGRYPKGTAPSALHGQFDEDIVGELSYYEYLEELPGGNLRITVKGREALTVHTLTVTNVVVALVAAVAACLALFL